MQTKFKKLLKVPSTGLFGTIADLMAQGKSAAQIKALLPNTAPQVVATFMASVKATLACDSCFAALAKFKGTK